jgi:hypothetical protein
MQKSKFVALAFVFTIFSGIAMAQEEFGLTILDHPRWRACDNQRGPQ